MNSRTRVLHLITGLNTGGAELALAHLLESMNNQEFDSHVVCLITPGPVGVHISSLGIPLDSLEMAPGRATLKGFIHLLKIIRDFRPHILQTWMYHSDFMGLIAGKLAGVPAIVWNIRGSEMNFMNSQRLSKFVARSCAALSGWPEVIIVNSDAGLVAHEKLGYHPRKWQLIPNGIDISVFFPDRDSGKKFLDEWHVPNNADVIGMVARLDPQKGYLDLLLAAALVIKKKPDVHFFCVGSGSKLFTEEIKAQASKLGLDPNIHWTGTRFDMPSVYNAFSVCVSASAYGEGFPNVIAEAMACGVPCIVTKTGDSPNLVAETGLVVPPRDPQSIADAILHLLSLSTDERASLGKKACQRIVSNYSLNKMTQEYTNTYRQLIQFQPSNISR